MISTTFTLVAALATAQPSYAEAQQCIALGGVGIPNFFVEGPDQPVTISATLIGSVQTAAGRILSQRETATGMEMEIEHYFGRSDGGAIFTKDVGVLTAIPDRPGRFMIEITYVVQPEKGRGTLKGYAGHFSSYGLVDLRDPNDLQGLVRYSGEICKQD